MLSSIEQTRPYRISRQDLLIELPKLGSWAAGPGTIDFDSYSFAAASLSSENKVGLVYALYVTSVCSRSLSKIECFFLPSGHYLSSTWTTRLGRSSQWDCYQLRRGKLAAPGAFAHNRLVLAYRQAELISSLSRALRTPFDSPQAKIRLEI